MKTLLRLLALLLALTLLCPTLLACANQEEPTEIDAEKSVGTVGGIEITYDELYFLIKTYEDSLTEQYADDPAALAEALDELVDQEIIANAAIRLLCEKRGLTYKPRKLSDEVDAKLESILYSDFGGDEEAYRASMEEHGLTERYLRYTTGLDILYGELTSVYPQENLVISSTPELYAYIMEHFICTYHIALFNDTPEENDANLDAATKARRDLVLGKKTMRDLIGSKINEDYSDVSGAGHYLTRGTWDEAYEKAAFSLEIGEVSEVILAMGESPKTSATVPTYYVIQRAELDKDYVSKNLSTLQDEYYASVIYSDLQEVREELSFEPNEFYASLDLTELLPPVEQENYTVLIVVLCSVGGALLVGGGLTAFLLIRRKKRTKSVQA
ncbi:MAG: hypothetical protein J6Q82_02285 [Clostridia bacterium]|nr:hypothetical protein [Clostridia bacterium]